MADDAEVPVYEEPTHRSRLTQKLRRLLAQQRIAVLGIPAYYGYIGTKLIQLLQLKCAPFLP